MNKYEYENQQRTEYLKKHPFILAMIMGFSGFIISIIGIVTIPILIGIPLLIVGVPMFIGGVVGFYGVIGVKIIKMFRKPFHK